jgi:pimeloyl-ACP methyl ester carboxylesterase
VALDARGHGASGKPHDPSFYGEEKMAGDLRQLFDLSGTQQVDLVGYSMGANVSLLTASQDTRVRRLMVCGVAPAPSSAPA